MFAGVYIENFPVQAAVRVEPELRERALVIVEGVAPLTKVVAMNAAARRAGVQIGMLKTTVTQFLGVEIRMRSLALEKSAHAALLDLGWSISPRIEDTAAGTIVVDAAGLGSVWGNEETIAKEVEQRGRACGLQLNVAMAGNIEAALVAARGFAGSCVIVPGNEAARLSELSVSVLPMTKETAGTLERWGVRTCGALAALPLLELSERLGREGVRLHALSRGEGTRAIVVAEAAHMFVEELELDDAVEELEPLSFLLARLLNQLCVRLTARALAANAIQMRFELEPAFDKALEARKEEVRKKILPGVFERTLHLPVPMRDATMLLKLVRLRLQVNPPEAAITKIRMTAEAARPRTTQNGLFLPSFPDVEKLELTLAQITNAVGEGNVGTVERIDTHRPDAFHVKPFVHKAVTESNDREEDSLGPQNENDCTGLSCRIFRPPLLAKVESEAQKPVRVFFAGMQGDVVAAAGPWKTSGEWWREDAWQQEEWDLELAFRTEKGESQRGVYRVYCDAKCSAWFVRGMYD
jgi:protein ImuB